MERPSGRAHGGDDHGLIGRVEGRVGCLSVIQESVHVPISASDDALTILETENARVERRVADGRREEEEEEARNARCNIGF